MGCISWQLALEKEENRQILRCKRRKEGGGREESGKSVFPAISNKLLMA